VLTHGDARTGWFHSHAIRAADLPRPKRESRRPLALFAGAGAAQALLGVINEIRLIRYPVLLGGGTPLFREGERRNLQLADTDRLQSGATLSRYRML
jgi:dihydrofolate reductase